MEKQQAQHGLRLAFGAFLVQPLVDAEDNRQKARERPLGPTASLSDELHVCPWWAEKQDRNGEFDHIGPLEFYLCLGTEEPVGFSQGQTACLAFGNLEGDETKRAGSLSLFSRRSAAFSLRNLFLVPFPSLRSR